MHVAQKLEPVLGQRHASKSNRAFSSPQSRRADGHALESYFVELIDAAKNHIEIVNPYLNLTPGLAQAFDPALARGVKIDIVGRIDLA